MSKKRALILVTALLPLGVGSAVVVSMNSGSRSVEPVPVAGETAVLDEALDDAGGSAPLLEDSQVDALPTFDETGAVPVAITEPLEQPSQVEEAQTLGAPGAHRRESTPASAGSVGGDTQLAALVDDGWQLHPRSHNSLGSMNIGLAGRSRGGGSGGGSAGGESSSDSDADSSVPPPTQSHEPGNTRPPVKGPSNGSNETDGSDESTGSTQPSGSNGAPADLSPPPQSAPPTKHEGTKPPADEVGGSDPVDHGGDGPIYIPPHDVGPPVVQVPEPETLGLLGLGLLGCLVARRRKAR